MSGFIGVELDAVLLDFRRWVFTIWLGFGVKLCFLIMREGLYFEELSVYVEVRIKYGRFFFLIMVRKA
jgi:hypothetical protein